MDTSIENIIKNWKDKNIEGIYCENRQAGADKILEIIPVSGSVGFSGSQTLEEIDVIRRLEERGNKLFNPYLPGLSREASLEIRKQAAQADFYLASANAVSLRGELVFLSAYGNRTAGISYAKNVIIVCGINKFTPDLESAIKRAREYATPLNYKRLNWDWSRMMICQTLIIDAEIAPDRLKVILVGESLGF
jgi:L-lactate utilization protein LutB